MHTPRPRCPDGFLLANVLIIAPLSFSEEVVRSQGVFLLGDLLSRLSKPLRETAGLGPWAISSTGAGVATGRLVSKALADVQGETFAEPTVLLSTRLNGMEDIPQGVVAVITPSAVDVLSHVALRARSQGVFLAGCEDAEQLAKWTELAGEAVTVSLAGNGDVVATKSSAPLVSASAAGGAAGAAGAAKGDAKVGAVAPATSGPWVIGEDAFKAGAVGGKGLKCAQMRSKLASSGVAVPASVSLPFGTFERVLSDPANDAVKAELASALAEVDAAAAKGGDPAAVSAGLQRVRDAVSVGLAPPEGLAGELEKALKAAGLVDAAVDMAPGSDAFWDAWEAVCKVWASKWTDRAWLRRASSPRGGAAGWVCCSAAAAPAVVLLCHSVNKTGP